MKTISVRLTAYNMFADSTEADFDRWTQYVNERIDALVDVSVEVDSYPYTSGPASDSVSAPDALRDTIADALTVLWEQFCAEPSASIDLFEDNSGGLAIVCRETGVGYRGFEVGQNERRLRASGRDEFTFRSDSAPEHLGQLDEGGAYIRLTAEDIERLYTCESEANAAVRVASCIDGRITVRDGVSIGLSARWYLDVER